MSPGTVSWRLRRGQWQRLHAGVYATFTGQPDREAMVWAALRRSGADAVLSHQTAAEFSELTSMPSSLIHVTVPRDHHVRPIAGVVVHRSNRVEQARHPTLTPPRTRIEETTLDLAACSRDLDDALAWLARACGARLTTPDRLRTALESRTRVRWRDALSAGLGDIAGGAHSALELRYVSRVERPHRLPRPQRQVRVVRGRRTEYRDALYTEYGVGVETDGAVAHPAEARWRDQHRDNAAAVEQDHHPALQLGRRDPASLSRRGGGGRSTASARLARPPQPLQPLLPPQGLAPFLARCIVVAMTHTMHRAD